MFRISWCITISLADFIEAKEVVIFTLNCHPTYWQCKYCVVLLIFNFWTTFASYLIHCQVTYFAFGYFHEFNHHLNKYCQLFFLTILVFLFGFISPLLLGSILVLVKMELFPQFGIGKVFHCWLVFGRVSNKTEDPAVRLETYIAL